MGAYVMIQIAHVLAHVVHHAVRGSGSQSHERYLRVLCLEHVQLHVIRSEIMTPLADTMCFVDHKPVSAGKPTRATRKYSERMDGWVNV